MYIVLFCFAVLFDLPVFTVELKADFGSGEQGLVDLSFKNLQVQYDRSHELETNIQVRFVIISLNVGVNIHLNSMFI